MAFAAVQIGAGSGAGGARQPINTIGAFSVELYSYTQANTDTGGTITTAMGMPLVAMASGNTATANDVGTSISGQVVTVATIGSGNSPTAGFVIVIGKPR